jgi:hypothetical protein
VIASPVLSQSQAARAEEKLTVTEAQLKEIVKSDIIDVSSHGNLTPLSKSTAI